MKDDLKKYVWRADTYTEQVEQVEQPAADTPMGIWMAIPAGGGIYRLDTTESESRIALSDVLCEESARLLEVAATLRGMDILSAIEELFDPD